MKLKLLFIILSLALLCTFKACSSDFLSVEPDASLDSISDNNRQIIGIWDVKIDEQNATFSIEPSHRTSDFHFPLTNLYPNALQIIDYHFGTPFTAEIRISHPMPGRGIDAYDPRVIAILPANPSVSMNYPSSGILANNSVLLDADGYTKLWDNSSIPGNANPFISYFELYPNRTWSSTDVIGETQLWRLDLSGFGGPFVFQLVLDISTNYPNPSQPIAGNAPEPVCLDATIGEGLTSDGGYAPIELSLIDWQGVAGIGGVVAESPELFDGYKILQFAGSGGTDQYIYIGNIPNELLAPSGDYPVLINAWDTTTGVHIYREFTAHVEQAPLEFKDVTPPWLNLRPYAIRINGNFIYAVYEEGQVHAFDISEPTNPQWLTKVDIPEESGNIVIDGNYAFIACNESGIAILNIAEPQYMSLFGYLDAGINVSDMFVDNGVLYAACGTEGLKIYDVNDMVNPVLLKTVLSNTGRVTVNNGYAYCSDSDYVRIIDVDPIDTAQLKASVHMPSYAGKIIVRSGYAYVSTSSNSVNIIDVANPLDPEIIEQTNTNGRPFDFSLSSNYLFAATEFGLSVVDIHNPSNTSLLLQLQELGWCFGIDTLTQQYAFITGQNGIRVIDITSPGLSHWVAAEGSLDDPMNITFDNGIAYIPCGNSFMAMIDVDPFEDFRFINKEVKINTSPAISAANGLAAVGNTNTYGYLSIVDTDPPEDAQYVRYFLLSTLGPKSLVVRDGYAYLVTQYDGFTIADIDPPADAHEIINRRDYSNLNDICLDSNYAFIASSSAGLLTYYMDPVEETELISTVSMPDQAKAVAFRNGYVFTADSSSGVQIVDVYPAIDAEIVQSVATPGSAVDIAISGDFAFVACDTDGLTVIDISNPETAFVLETMPLDGSVTRVDVYQNHAYVIINDNDLRIIELW